MTKIVGIDYGTVRTGIAITDSARIIASPLQTVATKELFVFLEALIKKENIEMVVIGEARYLNRQPSQMTELQMKFVDQLRKKFPAVEIARVDEAFTSVEASRAMHAMGMKKKEREKKENLDMISAALILQSYLDKR